MVLIAIVLPVNAFVSLAQSSYQKTKIVTSTEGSSGYRRSETTTYAIPYEVSFDQICLSGNINGASFKVYYTNDDSVCTISSLQATTLLTNGLIKEKNVTGEIVFGTVSEGSTVVLPSLTLGNATFTSVKFTVTDNLSFPIVVTKRLLRHKGTVHVSESNHTIYIY